jgi:Fic family protein
VETLPHPELFTAMYVRREAVLSSQIEGTQASLDDLVAVEARLRGDHPLGDVNEVLNYTAALRHGLERLQTCRYPVDCFGRSTPSSCGRAWRAMRRPVNIVPPKTGLARPEPVAGRYLRTATTRGRSPEHVGNLERFLHGDSRLSVIVQIGLAHAQFETIHPFVDGNGRLGRLLITFLLCERKVLSKPVLYVSLTLKKRRQEYYERLQAVRDRGAWEAWLVFFLDCVTEAALDAASLARRILRLREAHRDRVIDAMGARAGKALKASGTSSIGTHTWM